MTPEFEIGSPVKRNKIPGVIVYSRKKLNILSNNLSVSCIPNEPHRRGVLQGVFDSVCNPARRAGEWLGFDCNPNEL